MRRFKKVMMVTSVLGGVGLAAAGTAQAADCGNTPPPAPVGNTQLVDCDQAFQSSLVTINAPITVGGDLTQNIGNFCTVVAPPQ
ncbi:hypothetical protein M2271_001296 [Streptomyces sp. LBL]|uniref:hypothetical protein n=1 Tax=Streptomyces sp. LBL TaxID=2940562 RepID=UPI002473A145|nr:hypothetical protein [Streptomyces sp. LBL]MDH6623509.1 hypothetical protein [Streptomyces sp. LBL]